MIVDHEFRGMLKKIVVFYSPGVCVPTETEEYHEIRDFSPSTE